jgi:hypothetical protein
LYRGETYLTEVTAHDAAISTGLVTLSHRTTRLRECVQELSYESAYRRWNVKTLGFSLNSPVGWESPSYETVPGKPE